MNMDRWFREVTVPLCAEEIAAFLNGVVAGASFQPGIGKGGTAEPQAKMDAPGIPSSAYGGSDPYQQQVRLCAPDCSKPHPWHGGKAKMDGGKMCGPGCKKHPYHMDAVKLLTGQGSKGRLRAAAEEIATLAAGPHDVSGEARDKGQFAKTPGAGAAGAKPSPTGSPLDPATGVKPPPEPHEIHKQNMDYHSKAAKAMQSMVKQHLDLAKVALSPEDRQNHINQARQMKQLASNHVTEAGKHAQKMSDALKQKAMQPQAPAAAAPVMPAFHTEEQVQAQGLRKPNPQGGVATQGNPQAWVDHAKKPGGRLDPNNQTQQMPVVKKPWSAQDAIRRGVATRPPPKPPENDEMRRRRADLERSLGVAPRKPKPQGGAV
jgi:hypothetical protein